MRASLFTLPCRDCLARAAELHPTPGPSLVISPSCCALVTRLAEAVLRDPRAVEEQRADAEAVLVPAGEEGACLLRLGFDRCTACRGAAAALWGEGTPLVATPHALMAIAGVVGAGWWATDSPTAELTEVRAAVLGALDEVRALQGDRESPERSSRRAPRIEAPRLDPAPRIEAPRLPWRFDDAAGHLTLCGDARFLTWARRRTRTAHRPRGIARHVAAHFGWALPDRVTWPLLPIRRRRSGVRSSTCRVPR